MRLLACIGFLLLPTVTAPQTGPESWAARDSHEGLTVAADLYDTEARSRQRFGKKHPYAAGLVAIEVLFHNQNDYAIRVLLQEIRLILSPPGRDRQRLAPLAFETVLDRLLEEKLPDARRKTYPVPIGRPRNPRNKEWEKRKTELQPLVLEMDVIPPRATVRGFLFFDVNGQFDWLADARLYLPELVLLPSNKPLLFFELTLKPSDK